MWLQPRVRKTAHVSQVKALCPSFWLQVKALCPSFWLYLPLARLAVCYRSRQAFWSSVPKRGRLVRRLVPFAVVSLLLGADLTLERIEYRVERAAQHDVMASLDGGESSAPAPAPMPPGYRPRPDVADYHVRMRRRWERAAARPWLPVEPDPPPPQP